MKVCPFVSSSVQTIAPMHGTRAKTTRPSKWRKKYVASAPHRAPPAAPYRGPDPGGPPLRTRALHLASGSCPGCILAQSRPFYGRTAERNHWAHCRRLRGHRRRWRERMVREATAGGGQVPRRDARSHPGTDAPFPRLVWRARREVARRSARCRRHPKPGSERSSAAAGLHQIHADAAAVAKRHRQFQPRSDAIWRTDAYRGLAIGRCADLSRTRATDSGDSPTVWCFDLPAQSQGQQVEMRDLARLVFGAL
jgi:hypothetical protein